MDANYEILISTIRENLKGIVKERIRRRDELIARIRDSEEPVYIFGTGIIGSKLFDDLTELGIEISAFLDNNHEKWDQKTLSGILCISPNALLEKSATVFIGVGGVC